MIRDFIGVSSTILLVNCLFHVSSRSFNSRGVIVKSFKQLLFHIFWTHKMGYGTRLVFFALVLTTVNWKVFSFANYLLDVPRDSYSVYHFNKNFHLFRTQCLELKKINENKVNKGILFKFHGLRNNLTYVLLKVEVLFYCISYCPFLSIVGVRCIWDVENIFQTI